MSYGYAAPVTGVITQAATAGVLSIPIPGSGDLIKFEIWDETQFGLNSANTNMLAAWWYKDMNAGSAFVQNRTSGQLTANTINMVTTGGFTLVDPNSTPQLQAAKTRSGASTITSAQPAVVTIASHGYSNGDTVLLTNTTGLLQIAGMAFTIGSVTTNTFTLVNLDTTLTNLTSTATAVTAQKLNYLSFYTPRRLHITNIGTANAVGTQGAGTSSIITLATTHSYTVGQAVRIYVPNAFIGSGTNVFVNPGTLGTSSTSQQIVAATITAINTADASGFTNTITVNINSTGTTFQWPTSATAAAGVNMPFVEPVGEAATVPYQNLLDDRTQNTGNVVMQLGSNVYGVASDVIRWIAWRGAVQS